MYYKFQLAFTCSKSQIKALEKGVKYVQSYQYKHLNDINGLVLVFLLLLWTYFTSFSSVSIANFEQVNVMCCVI